MEFTLRRSRLKGRAADDLRSRVEQSLTRRPGPDLVARLRTRLATHGFLGLAFDESRRDVGEKAVLVPSLSRDVELWFLGDIHGDLLALEAALQHIEMHESSGRRAITVLLGDLIDRNPFGLEVIFALFSKIDVSPGRFCCVAGNHDIGLRYTETFESDVEPSEFKDSLNVRADDFQVAELGRLAIDVFASFPRALFFPDGFCAVHGGIPLSDLHASLLSQDDLNSEKCLDDFTWTRAHPSAPRKIPNRYARGASFGYQDLHDFFNVASSALGRPVSAMIRGHDHFPERFFPYPDYPASLLAVNTFSRRLPEEFSENQAAPVSVVRHTMAGRTEIHQIQLPQDLIDAFYGPTAAGESPSRTSF